MIRCLITIWVLTGYCSLDAKDIPGRNLGPDNITVRDFCLSGSGKTVFATRDNMIDVYEIESGRHLDSIKFENTSTIQAIALSADSSFLVSGFTNGAIVIHNLVENRTKLIIASNQKITTVAVNIYRNLIAAGTYDGDIVLLDMKGRLVDKMKKHDDVVSDIEFSNDGRYLVSSGLDGKIHVWDFIQEKSNFYLVEKNSPCRDVTFSNDVSRLMASFDNGKVLSWRIEPDARFVVDDICKHNGWSTSTCYHTDNQTWTVCTTSGIIKIYIPSGFTYRLKLRHTLTQISFIPLHEYKMYILVSIYKKGLRIIGADEMVLKN